jgi:cytidylate kinase
MREQQHINKLLAKITSGLPFWQDYWESSIQNAFFDPAVHLAILVEPYLSFILNGRKTIESRFSINRIAPFDRIQPGDIVLLKRAGGPLVGISQAINAWFYQVDHKSLVEIRQRFGPAICAQDEDFWNDRSSTSFATLIQLGNVSPVKPTPFEKKDRRGWVVLKSRQQDAFLFPGAGASRSVIVAISGPIGSGKTTLSRKLAEFLKATYISFGQYVRSIANQRELSTTRESLQRLGEELIAADPAEFCRQTLQFSKWKPGDRAVIDGIRHVAVLKFLREEVAPLPLLFAFLDLDDKTRAQRRGVDVAALKTSEQHSTESELAQLRKLADLYIDGQLTTAVQVTLISKAVAEF